MIMDTMEPAAECTDPASTTMSVQQRTDLIRSRLEEWRPSIESPPPVLGGSDLAADDASFPELPVSQLAWWGITVAFEHLDVLLALQENQMALTSPMAPTAPYTLLRPALLGASQAVVLLGPDQPEDRSTNGLKLAHEEYRNLVSFLDHMVEHDGLTEEGRAVAETVSTERYVSARDRAAKILSVRGVKQRKLSDTDMVTQAAKLAYPGNDLRRLALENEWRQGSGAGHGRLLVTLLRPGTGGIEDQYATFAADPGEVSLQTYLVFALLKRALELWDLRNTSKR